MSEGRKFMKNLLTAGLILFCGWAGRASAATLGDRVWDDSDWNGLQDLSEPGMPGIIVRLRAGGTSQVAVTATDANGIYLFTNVAAGTYRVEVLNPDPLKYKFTGPNVGANDAIDSDVSDDGLSDLLTLGAGDTNLDVDAGLQFFVPGLSFTKLVGGVPHGQILYVAPGTPVVYTYIVTNTGNTWFSPFSVWDDVLGLIGSIDPPSSLGPGQVVIYAATSTIFVATTNSAGACGIPCDPIGDPLGTFQCADDVGIVELCPPPGIVCPPDRLVPCDGSLSTNALGVPIVTSNLCQCVVTISYQDVPATNFCLNAYLFERRFTISDDCAHTAYCTQRVVVTDSSAPVLVNVPANTNVSCDAVPGPGTVTGTDNCSPTVYVSFVQTRLDGNCANSYQLRRVWTGTDVCGNSRSATQIVTVSDTFAPVLVNVPANTNVFCDAVPGPGMVMGTDNCSPTVYVSFVQTRLDGNCTNNYTLRRVWTGTDACGNSRSATQLVTVTDTFAPVLVNVPANTNATCDAVPGPGTVTGTDNCSPTVYVSFVQTRLDGNCTNNYTLRRVWTGWDVCGNSMSATQLVTVRDTTAPVLTCPPLLTVTGNVQCEAAIPQVWLTVSDNCSPSGTLVVTQSPPVGTVLSGAGTTLVTVAAMDSCGNAATGSTLVAVVCASSPAQIGDFVWHDSNWNGLQDGGETGMAGAVVTLCDAASNVVGVATTGVSGLYLFTGLTPGTYLARFMPPAGSLRTLRDEGMSDVADSDADPLTGWTTPIVVTSGESDLTWDAGVQGAALRIVAGPEITGTSLVVWVAGVPGGAHTMETASNASAGVWLTVTNFLAPTNDEGFGVGALPFYVPVPLPTSQLYRLLFPAP